MQDSIRQLYAREIDRLITELNAYKNESKIWQIEGDVNNSAGSLALHLAGNLQHFFGAVLSGSNYKRDREREFSAKNTPRKELISELEKAKQVVDHTITNLSSSDLKKEYPAQIRNEETSTEYALLHLFWHLGYHVGQVAYHRRLLDN